MTDKRGTAFVNLVTDGQTLHWDHHDAEGWFVNDGNLVLMNSMNMDHPDTEPVATYARGGWTRVGWRR